MTTMTKTTRRLDLSERLQITAALRRAAEVLRTAASKQWELEWAAGADALAAELEEADSVLLATGGAS